MAKSYFEGEKDKIPKFKESPKELNAKAKWLDEAKEKADERLSKNKKKIDKIKMDSELKTVNGKLTLTFS
jgi:tetrahydromethanopterin S-methyltransferase subunit G